MHDKMDSLGAGSIGNSLGEWNISSLNNFS
jgi:hypothetical protein